MVILGQKRKISFSEVSGVENAIKKTLQLVTLFLKKNTIRIGF